MSKDFYKTLGLNKGASDQEIKSAYRKLARKWHPDVASDKAEAESKFKEVNEAYQVLSDPQKKGQYDQFGTTDFGGAAGGPGHDPFSGFSNQGGGFGPFKWSYSSKGPAGANGSGFEGVDPFDVFEQVFGFRGFGGQRKGRDLKYVLNIDFEDSIKGVDNQIKVNGHKLKINLPPGVQDGTQVRFTGKGENPGGNIQAGDLYIVIEIKPSRKLTRQGADIFSVQDISMKQAVLGDTVDIEIVDPDTNSGYSTVKMKIPKGTQPNTKFKLKSKGMPITRNKNTRGDHYVQVNVVIPKKVSRDQRESIENLF